ncbi:hypothetical protein [uncultured Shewanella sp.]|uniref:hypothetical protein n=1 Tax=uncultured Shewanella sp. TaxID=173975 RepID=UPI002631330F|nr:hypothetical protein [uncultured Shewanella sp.]
MSVEVIDIKGLLKALTFRIFELFIDILCAFIRLYWYLKWSLSKEKWSLYSQYHRYYTQAN